MLNSSTGVGSRQSVNPPSVMPAALVTAIGETPEIQAAIREGMLTRVISKPWNPSGLLSEALELATPT